MRQLERDDFFWNSLLAPGPGFGVLCGLVEQLQLGTVVISYTRVFRSQPDRHVELDFLHWLWSLETPNDDFLVTCFISWSPCPRCAEEVDVFLGARHNMRLRMLAARLPWDPQYREALGRLQRQGVLVDAMSWEDFDWCWELFVRRAGTAFEAWWGPGGNRGLPLGKLQDILGTRMKINTFMEHFDNSPNNYIHATLLCYEVQGAGGHIPKSERKGILLNRGRNTDHPAHAEVVLLERVWAWALAPELPCSVTCYISWSPCVECARELVQFLGQHPGVELSIRAARIYSLPGYQDGLRHLRDAGVRVSIMTRADFEHCWATFVQSDGQPFAPPPNLEDVSKDLAMELEHILQAQEGTGPPSGPWRLEGAAEMQPLPDLQVPGGHLVSGEAE